MDEVRQGKEEDVSEPGAAPDAPADEAAPEADREEADASAEPSAEPSPEVAPEPAVEEKSAEEPAAEEPGEDRFRWYVVHTYSGHEERAAKNIERAVKQAAIQDQVPRVLVPTESVAEMKNGKKTITDRKFFPSYVLVKMEMSGDAWRVISNTPGVTRFVGVGSKPQPLSDEEIERILGRIEGTKEKPTPTIPFHIGEHVKVCDGPFTEFAGVVDEVHPERGKLKVMVSIFGRPVPVELDFLQVKSL
jgi:transcriptional antiterminator NusG